MRRDAGAERCVGRGGIDLFHFSLSPDDFVRQEPALAMMLSVYVTLGIFLLLAARNPSAKSQPDCLHAWPSFVHTGLMAVQAFRHLIPREGLWGVSELLIIGVALIVLAPAKSVERVRAAIV
jgi:hypothetical protein